MHSWNLEKIYSQNVASVGSIPQERFRVLREFKDKQAIKQAILNVEPAFKAGSDKKGAIRLAPVEKMEKEEVKQKFDDAIKKLSLLLVGTIPGGPGAPSGKFDSYVVKDESDKEYVITLAGGAFSNEGMAYERDVMEGIKRYFDERGEKPDFVAKLENALGVEFIGYDPGAAFGKLVKRPLSDKGPQNKGEEIADMTLIAPGKKYYISLKDVGGKTVGNAGASGMFKLKGDDDVEFANQERDSIGKKLMDAAGVNIDLAVKGLEDYLTKSPSREGVERSFDVTGKADKEKLRDFLKSAFDYGYIYVKRKNAANDLEVIELDDEKKLDDFIGSIQKVLVKYPFYRSEGRTEKRKHISIVIVTNEGNYSFDIRNAGGGIIPNQINLVRLGSVKDAKAAQASAEALRTADEDLSGILSKY